MTKISLEENLIVLERQIAAANTVDRIRVLRRLCDLVDSAAPKRKVAVRDTDDDLLFDNMPV